MDMTEPVSGIVGDEPLDSGTSAKVSWAKQRSSIGVRIAGRIAVIFFLFGLVQFFVVREMARQRFEAIEQTNLLDRTRQVFLSFEREGAALKTLTTSTAAWRDTYEFAVHPTQGYLTRNFSGDWPQTYNIHFVLMVDMNGKKIWSSDGYPSFPSRGPARFAVDHFDRHDPHIFPQGYVFPGRYDVKPSDAFVGLVGTDRTAWIYCAHAITNDDKTAPPRGILIFGRMIDQQTLDSLAFGHQDDLSQVPSNAVPAAGEFEEDAIAQEFPVFGGSRTVIRHEGDRLVSYSPISDTAGNPLGAFKLSILRNAEQAGNRLVWLMSLLLLAAAVITLGAILLAIRATVILPISRLASFFTSQEEAKDEILQTSAQRKDEIGILAAQARSLMLKVKEQHAELENQANTDRLTGLPNRRSFESHINKEFRRLLRSKRGNLHKGQMAVAVLDVDHFKLFNDTNGHIAGDACLRAIAESIRSCIFRAGDLACRFGGEEFVLVLPDTDEAGALVVSETVRAAVEQMALPHSTSPVAGFVTVSVGVAALEVTEDFKIEPLIERADLALYAAKKAGRNRVVGSSSLV